MDAKHARRVLALIHGLRVDLEREGVMAQRMTRLARQAMDALAAEAGRVPLWLREAIEEDEASEAAGRRQAALDGARRRAYNRRLKAPLPIAEIAQHKAAGTRPVGGFTPAEDAAWAALPREGRIELIGELAVVRSERADAAREELRRVLDRTSDPTGWQRRRAQLAQAAKACPLPRRHMRNDVEVEDARPEDV